ncbi:MAG: hypothetical protein JSV51_00435 [Candidatus Bathyarchaeota archaeon]|nr:MAG: hypothetical protein JSV51_00435 [Candidatus Bathyarchaeota archaeon]
MNVPLRALGWAVRFFWIIALAFAVTAVYSATFIRIDFGKPMLNFTEKDLMIMIPMIFDNKGYYNLADLNITTFVVDHDNESLSEDTTYLAQINFQDNATIFHNITLSIDELITQSEYYLFNDSSLILYGSTQLSYANLIPLGFESNEIIPWGAPLSDFTIGIPEFSAYNRTHFRVNVPISFDNHSQYFSVTGTIRIEFLNNGQVIWRGATSVDVPSNTTYNGEVETLVEAAMVIESGQIHFWIETPIFGFGPLVIENG